MGDRYCSCPPMHECAVHGIKDYSDKQPRVRKSMRQQSEKQALRERYLAGVKAGFLFMLRKLDPDGPTCEECGVRGNSTTLDLDHIVLRSRASDDRPDNLQLLCRDCHRQKHGEPQWSAS